MDPAISVAPAENVEATITPEKDTPKRRPPRLAPEFRKQFKVDQKDERPKEPLVRSDNLPPLKILVDEREARPDQRHINHPSQ